MKLLLSWLLALTVAAGCRADAPKQVSVPEAFRSWTIAFIRNGSIWTAAGNGANQKLAIRGSGAPCWSRDKRRLAFYRDGNIWIADANGRNVRQLTHYGRGHRERSDRVTISWNRKANSITYSRSDLITGRSAASGARCEVYGTTIFDLCPAMGRRPAASVRFDVSNGGFHFADNDNPAWSRSGEVLAFTRNGDIWVAQYVPEEDGGRAGWDITRLAPTARYDEPTYRASSEPVGVTSLSWSPDGKHLTYCLNRLGGSGTAELHVITLRKDNSPCLAVVEDRKLLDDCTPSGSSDAWQPEHACFSPDGNWISFSSAGSVYAISPDGKRIVKLLSKADQAVW